MKTITEILEEIDSKIEFNLNEAREAAKMSGINCPGANQPMGAADELQALKDWILEED